MAGHVHGAVAEAGAAGGEPLPCVYCPPADTDHGTCDGHRCLFPHDPQVDARAAGVLFSALPVAFVLPMPQVSRVSGRAEPPGPAFIPRVPIPVSYCRFIE